MKSFQLILLLVVLAAAIFLITFFKMYVHTPVRNPAVVKTSTTQAEGPILQLHFYSTHYPLEFTETTAGQPRQVIEPPEFEFDRDAHHDFWFYNPNNEATRVGLNKKSCTCANVFVFVAEEAERKPLTELAVAPLLNLGLGNLSGLTQRAMAITSTAVIQQEQFALQERLATAAGKGGGLMDKEDTHGVTIPAHGLGIVRLLWHGKRKISGSIQPETLTAELWFHSKPSGAGTNLQVRALLLDSTRMDRTEASVQSLRVGDAPRQVVFRCWSSTRPRFTLTSTLKAEPLYGVEIQPLTDGDEQALRALGGSVRSGYRVVVTVRERSVDGTHRLDLGPFRRRIELKAMDGNEEIGNHLVLVEGTMRGGVRVLAPGGRNDGVIALGTFAVRTGRDVTATVEADKPGQVVKIERHPDFMEVHLEKDASASGRPTWRLHVKVLPLKVVGDLKPDRSEIILRVEGAGDPVRQVRIPVTGTATQ